MRVCSASAHALKQAAREEEGGGGYDLVCGDRQLRLRSVGTHAGHCGTHQGCTAAGKYISVVLVVYLWRQYAWVGDAGGWLSGLGLTEELNRSQHTQQLRQTRIIGRQQPHANLHADGARAGGTTFFGAGAGARSGLLLSCHCCVLLCLRGKSTVKISPPPAGSRASACVTACSPLPTRPWRVNVLQRHALGKVPYPLGLAGVAPRRWHLQK